MLEQELLVLERDFWLGDAYVFEQRLAPESLMVFPAPVGALNRNKIIESIAGAPRWKNARFSSPILISPSPEVAILAYQVEADRGGGMPKYRAECSSTYVCLNSTWKLALHQQTPDPDDR